MVSCKADVKGQPGSLLVCRKCGEKKRAKKLRSWLARELEGAELRVALTGCLDVCPKKDRVTVALGEGARGAWVVDPKRDRPALLQAVVARLAG